MQNGRARGIGDQRRAGPGGAARGDPRRLAAARRPPAGRTAPRAPAPRAPRVRPDPLAERLRTSRTPVREALILLAREGLVDIEPRRGAIVRSFDGADLADLYDVRAL